MKIVIEGAGEVGSHLAKMLRAEDNEVTVIDNDSQRLDNLASYADVEVITGNPSSLKVLREAGADKADLFIAVYPYTTQEVNIVGALLAKQLGAAKVIARINDEEFLSAENKLLFKQLGIDFLFYPEKSAADEIVEFLKHSSTAENMDFARGKLQITVFKLDDEAPVLDMKLADFIASLPAESLNRFRILAISREEKTIIPKIDTCFRYGDLVFTVATKEGVSELYHSFGKSNISIKSAMILGGGHISEILAASLDKQGVKVKIIEGNRERCIALSEKLPESVQIIKGDGRNSDFLFEEGIKDFDSFIALTGNDETNVLACVMAKRFNVLRTVAEVENIEYIRLAEDMGVDTVINKKLITAGRIFKFTLTGKARFVRYMTGTNAEVIEYTVAPKSAITKGAIKDINFPPTAIIAGIIRGSEAIIAVGDTVIEPYDRVAVFALPESIKEIDRFFK